MILADTTIIVSLLRTGDSRLVRLLQTHDAAICGITRAELLHGVRTPTDRVRVATALNTVKHVLMPDALWDEVGEHLAMLRAAGLPMPLADVIIASLAIHLAVELWTYDQHYSTMQSVLSRLQLFAEPP